jgi:hypothetical protein
VAVCSWQRKKHCWPWQTLLCCVGDQKRNCLNKFFLLPQLLSVYCLCFIKQSISTFALEVVFCWQLLSWQQNYCYSLSLLEQCIILWTENTEGCKGSKLMEPITAVISAIRFYLRFA